MFDELTKYKHSDHFFFKVTQKLAKVCNAPADKSGVYNAWGCGTIKILDTCKEAESPEPKMQELDGDFSITLFKNNLTEEQLIKLGLNARQIKAVLFVKEKGKISNADCPA